MSCRVTRQKNGKIKEVLAPNGVKSSLYEDLKNFLNQDLAKELAKNNQYISDRLSENVIRDDSVEEVALGLWSMVYTPEFKSWFGDSKVVDDNGEPLLVYHGTRSTENFTEFKLGGSGGIFFSDDRNYTLDFSGDTREMQTPFFIKIESPFYPKEELDNDVAFENKNKGDGLIGNDFGQGLTSDGKTYVIYNTGQVKSAFNFGNFSKASDNIYYSLGTESDTREATSKVKAAILQFLQNSGLSVTSLDEYEAHLRAQGESFDKKGINALVDFLNGVVALKRGVSDYVFIEEAAHIAVEFMPMDSSMRRALELVSSTSAYAEHADNYRSRYRKINPNLSKEELELKVRKEVLGKLIADHVLTNNNNNITYRLLRTLKSIWEKFVKLFKNNERVNELQTTIQNISDNLTTPSNFISRKVQGVSEVFFNADEEPARKILRKIIENLSNRLKDLKQRRLAKKTSQKLEEDIRRLQDKLDSAQEQDGLISFVEFVKEDVLASKKYIEEVRSKKKVLSSKQLLLLHDFIEYYSPLLGEIKRNINSGNIFSDLPQDRKEEYIEMIKSYIAAFDDVKDFYLDAHAEVARNNIKDFFNEQGWEIDFDLDKAFTELPQDAWAVQTLFGSIRDVSSDIGRVIYGMVGRVIQKVNRQATEIGRDLINKIINDLGVKDTSVLAEVDSDGNTTGFFVTKYRLGEFYRDYDKFTEDIKKRYNLSESQREPSNPKEALAYRKEVNRYLSENTEREYTKEYYDLMDNLSFDTREAQLALDVQRQDILSRAKNAEGDIDYYLLTDYQFRRLEEIDIEKRKLAKLFYQDGTKKTGKDLQIAEELSEFNKKVSERMDYTLRKEAFEAARDYAKDNYSAEEYKKWEERNKEIVYDKEWWETIKEMEKREYSKEVQELEDKKSELLSPYRDSQMQVKYHLLPNATIEEVQRIDRLIAELRKGEPKTGGNEFWEHAKIEPTDYYFAALKEAEAKGEAAKFKENANYINHKGREVLHSYWTHIVPKNSKYIQEVPSKNWNELSRDSEFFNKEYDETWSGKQPKLSKWGNPQFKNLTDSQRKALDILIDLKKEMNGYIPISERNTYMLPQISKDLNDLIARKDITVSSMKELLKDSWEARVDDTEFGEQNFIERPDHSVGNYVPTYYTRMLENPANVSTDLVSSMILYSKMAINFKEMTELAPRVEVVKEEFGKVKYKTWNAVKKGRDTNVYKMIETFLEMQMYGKRRDRADSVPIPFTTRKLDISKAANNINSYIRANNLMFNPFAILSGFFNGVINSSIETLTGKYISKSSSTLAAREWMNNLPHAIEEIKEISKHNKVNVMLEHFRVLEGFDKVFDNLDKDKFLRYTKEDLVYMGYGLGDYALKVNIALSIMFNYRLYEGKFYTEEQFKKIENPSKQFKELTSVYDMYEVKNSKLVPKKEYEKLIDSKVEDYLEYTMKIISSRVDGTLSDIDRSRIHQSVWGQLVGTHRGWLIRGIADRWKAKGKNYMTGEIEAGSHREFISLFKNALMSEDRMTNLKQLFAMSDSLEPYQREAIARTLYEIVAVVFLAIMAGIINAASDDEEAGYGLEFAAYLTNRVLLETAALSLTPTPVPYTEVLTVLNSPVAGTKQLETIQDITDLFKFDTIERGPYKGLPRAAKIPLKLTPGIKGLMQLRDPDSANQFLKNKPLKWHPAY